MRLSTRYALVGILVGLFAPAALMLYGLANAPAFDPLWSAIALAAGGAGTFALVGRIIGRRDELLLARNRELAELSEQLRALSTTDALTGLHNRRSFDARLDMELARTARYGAPCALVMVDLDHFKDVNDRHGHLAGDAILRHVGAVLEAERRTGDLVARYGGEELAAILPHTTAAEAYAWADRVRARLAREGTSWAGQTLTVTASFGVSASPPHEPDPSALVEEADRALYAAKRKGRKTVVVSKARAQAAATFRARASMVERKN